MYLAALLLSHVFLCCHEAAQAVLFHNLETQKCQKLFMKIKLSLSYTCLKYVRFRAGQENLEDDPGADSINFSKSVPLKMGLIEGPETLVRNYHYSLHNNPQECSSQEMQKSVNW